MGDSKKHFRYFDSRNISVVKNHYCTLVLVSEEGVPSAYGHLEMEGADNWLGICVRSEFKGMGMGQKMMDALLAYGKKIGLKEISLMVDNDNPPAINLYKKNGFVNNKVFQNTSKYKLNLSKK